MYIVINMNDNNMNLGSVQAIDELEKRLDIILEKYSRLAKENEMLKQQQEYLSSEKAAILEKHHQLFSKLEAVVVRLKGLE